MKSWKKKQKLVIEWTGTFWQTLLEMMNSAKDGSSKENPCNSWQGLLHRRGGGRLNRMNWANMQSVTEIEVKMVKEKDRINIFK